MDVENIRNNRQKNHKYQWELLKLLSKKLKNKKRKETNLPEKKDLIKILKQVEDILLTNDYYKGLSKEKWDEYVKKLKTAEFLDIPIGFLEGSPKTDFETVLQKRSTYNHSKIVQPLQNLYNNILANKTPQHNSAS